MGYTQRVCCDKYRENLEEKATKTRKAILELNDPLLTPHIVWRELDISDECSKYKDFLEMFIIESGMTVAEPYPKDGHELDVEIVDRNNGICNLETTVGIQLKLQAVYSKSKQSITSIKIDDINDYNCLYCPY